MNENNPCKKNGKVVGFIGWWVNLWLMSYPQPVSEESYGKFRLKQQSEIMQPDW
jgi:hypothetical protein